MSILTILTYPDPRLHKIAAPVVIFDDALKKLADDMAETMYAAPGVGLAATQVNVHKRVITIDTSEARDDLLVLVNPRIVKENGRHVYEEGCLSVPGVYEEVERAEHIEFEFEDVAGRIQCRSAEGLLAVCVQHEMDHLRGKVFVEYLSRLKQSRIRAKMEKDAKKKAA
jgi:peptide deformylase